MPSGFTRKAQRKSTGVKAAETFTQPSHAMNIMTATPPLTKFFEIFIKWVQWLLLLEVSQRTSLSDIETPPESKLFNQRHLTKEPPEPTLKHRLTTIVVPCPYC